MERKVGEQFRDDNILLEVVQSDSCNGCYFQHINKDCYDYCRADERPNYKDEVIYRFVKDLSIDSILSRSYKATVKRGYITPDTNFHQFVRKIEEERTELIHSFDLVLKTFDPKELADIVLTCFNMAKHYGIDLIQVMEEKTTFNEQRKD